MSRAVALQKETVATVATRTVSGRPIQEHRGRLRPDNLRGFRLDDGAIRSARKRLESAGFRIVKVGRFAITVAGPAALFSDTLKVELKISALPPRITASNEPRALSWEEQRPSPRHLFMAPSTGMSVAGTRLSRAIDHFVFIPPPVYFHPRRLPPTPSYWHLTEKAIRRLLKVDRVPETGKDVRLCIIDSGFAVSHPYYAERSFEPHVISADGGDPLEDTNGHGTGITMNALAVAPGAEFVLVKNQPNAQAAFDAALEQKPKIISCSWGWPYEQSFPTLEATIRSAVLDDGITVLFAAGNGDMAWPGSVPEVVSVGGVYADEADELQASSYASGYWSSLYRERRVPDVSGLVGLHPRGIYIVMPTPPGSEMDRGFGGKSWPQADETGKNDGWVVASGTSSATPQLAGIAALLLERNPELDPAAVKSLLESTATAVTSGSNALGFPATGHPNVAVGWGLADAQAAMARLDAGAAVP